MKVPAFAFVLLTALLLFHGATLLRYPPPFSDEGWLASRAWAWRQQGGNLGAMDHGVFDYYDTRASIVPWLPTLLYGTVIRDAPSWLALRATSLVVGAGLLIALYALASALLSPRLAWLVVGATGFSFAFISGAHLVRPDGLCAMFGYAALALIVRGTQKDNTLWHGIGAALLVLFAVESHPNGLFFALTGLALLSVHQGWRQRAMWGFALTGMLGVLSYYALHIMPNPAAYAAQAQLAFAERQLSTLEGIAAGGRALFQFLYNYYPLLAYWRNPFVLLGIVIGLLPLLLGLRYRTFSVATRTVFLISGIMALNYIAFIRFHQNYYLIVLAPAIEMLTITLLWQAWQGVERYSWKAVGRACLVGLFALNMFFTVQGVLRSNRWDDFERVAAAVVHSTQPEDRIMLAPTFWLALYEADTVSREALKFYRRYDPSATGVDAMTTFAPTLLLLEGLSPDPTAPLPPTYSDLQPFLNKHATLLTAFDSGHYGGVRLYRISYLGTESLTR